MTDQTHRAAATERGPEPDALQRFATDLKERKNFYVGVLAAALAVVVLVLILVNRGESEGPDMFSPVWEAYTGASERIAQNRPSGEELARLQIAVDAARGSKSEAAALWLSAIAHYGAAFTKDKVSFEDRKPDLEAAKAALAELHEGRFDYFPPSLSRWFTSTGLPPVEQMTAHVDADLKWAEENTYTEPTPDIAPTAVLRTDAGDIHLRFYSGLAPKHVENFIALAKKGTYNGTAFHFARGGDTPIGVSGGDPLTYFYNDPLKKAHILRWGEGGTGYDVPPEASRYRIVHRRAVVTAQRRENADWDNGAQFQILLDADPSLDRSYSPFARVAEGMQVVEKIAKRPSAHGHPTFKDDPAFKSLSTQGLIVDPVWILKVIIYDEAGNAAQHDFPLTASEKKLSSLKDAAAKPLSEEDLRAGRKLVDPSKAEKFRGGLDIPFPGDFASPEKESPEGERRVAERVNATGQEPTKEKEPEDATDGTTDGATDGTGDGEKKDG